ncbi:MAG: 50S ribosomal protein L29 [Actinomycetia bacterium]|nr:50S ribosomal protein L29 [Actinomycetes bacterium]
MKASQLRELSSEEIDKKLVEAKQNLFNLRFQLAIGKLENVAKVKEIKKEIARILTVKYEKEREIVDES